MHQNPKYSKLNLDRFCPYSYHILYRCRYRTLRPREVARGRLAFRHWRLEGPLVQVLHTLWLVHSSKAHANSQLNIRPDLRAIQWGPFWGALPTQLALYVRYTPSGHPVTKYLTDSSSTFSIHLSTSQLYASHLLVVPGVPN